MVQFTLPRNSKVVEGQTWSLKHKAPGGFGQVFPPVILEFFGSANSTICLAFILRSSLPGLTIHPFEDGCAGRSLEDALRAFARA